MSRKTWTILVVDEEQSAVRQFRLSREVIRGAIAAVLLVASLLSSFGTAALVSRHGPTRIRQLQEYNQTLQNELAQLKGQMSELDSTFAELSRRNDDVRILAGLEPLDEGVRMAGIGGPDDEAVTSNPLWKVDRAASAAAFSAGRDLSALLRRAQVLAASWDEANDSLVAKHARLAATPSITPTQGFISSSFTRARWHPILERARPHQGLDIAAQAGTPIKAPARGRVRFAGQKGQFGLTVEIDHGYGYVTRFAHSSRLLVKTGQTVNRGDVIAEVGSTGLSVAPHLHYEVLVNGRQVDPRNFLLDLEVVP